MKDILVKNHPVEKVALTSKTVILPLILYVSER
jgi:hypothetical protein